MLKMTHEKNPFNTALGKGRPLIGVWSMLGSSPVVELIGGAGFDWMLLDMEHGPIDIDNLRSHLTALNGSATMPVVRVKWNDMVEIKRILDLGAQTIMVPQIQSREEARQAVANTRYPPHGVRGVAGGTRATNYGRRKDYFQHASDGISVLVQAESQAALDNLPEIASVDGVDGVFIGPSDLAASLGFLGNPSHPTVHAAIEKAVKTIRSAGKYAGTIATQEAGARKMLGLGFDFVAVGIDVGLLSQAADTLAAKFINGLGAGNNPINY